MRKFILSIFALAIFFLLPFNGNVEEVKALESYDNSEVVVVDFESSNFESSLEVEVYDLSNEANAPPEDQIINFELIESSQYDIYRDDNISSKLYIEKDQTYPGNPNNLLKPFRDRNTFHPLLC